MKKSFILVILLILLTISYIGWWRYTTSNVYIAGFVNKQVFSGNLLQIPVSSLETGDGISVSNKHHFIETVIFPVKKDEKMTIHMSGGYILALFYVYNTLGYEEYKLSNSLFSSGMGGDLSIDTSKNLIYGVDCIDSISCPITSLLRNSVFDKGGELKSVIMQIATPLSGMIQVSKTEE